MNFHKNLFSQEGGATCAYLIYLCVSGALLLASGIGTIVHVEDRNSLVQTECTTVSKTEGPFTCCFAEECTCLEASSDLPRCSTFFRDQREGSCADGSRCCRYQTITYECGQTCTGTEEERTCTTDFCTRRDCAVRVRNEICKSKCYTCYNPKVTLSYPAKETPDGSEIVTNQTLAESCRKSLSCANNFLNSFAPVDSSQDCFYDPKDYKKLEMDNEYSDGWFIFSGISGGIFVCALPPGAYLLHKDLTGPNPCSCCKKDEDTADVELEPRRAARIESSSSDLPTSPVGILSINVQPLPTRERRSRHSSRHRRARASRPIRTVGFTHAESGASAISNELDPNDGQ